MCGSTRQNKYLFISKSGKPIETRLHITRALNPRKACKKKISEFIFNLIPRVSNIYGTFDDEDLLHGHYYWKSERPGDIKLPDRQFLNPHKKAGCFSYRDEVFIWKILFLLLPRQDAKHPGFI